MECKESQNLMSAYIDDALDSSTANQLAMHLANCPACTNVCEEMLGLRTAIKTHAMRYIAPSHLQQRIQNALQREKRPRRKLAQLPWTWVNFGVATASSVAFAFTLALYLAVPSETERLDQEIVASHFRSLMPNHLADIASSDQHTVKPWFSGKLDFSPPVHDLAQEGFPLVGGRLDYINQRPVAALAYRHHQHVLNLYVWPDKTNSDVPSQITSKQGYQLIRWSQSGMHYRAISDMNIQDLLDFKRQLTSQIDKDR